MEVVLRRCRVIIKALVLRREQPRTESRRGVRQRALLCQRGRTGTSSRASTCAIRSHVTATLLCLRTFAPMTSAIDGGLLSERNPFIRDGCGHRAISEELVGMDLTRIDSDLLHFASHSSCRLRLATNSRELRCIHRGTVRVVCRASDSDRTIVSLRSPIASISERNEMGAAILCSTHSENLTEAAKHEAGSAERSDNAARKEGVPSGTLMGWC